jgi:hypothetical protein
MPARTHRALCVSALAVLGVTACAPATSSSARESLYTASVPPLTPTSRVISAERIQRSGSLSALDAIRALVPGYRSIEASQLGATWLGTSAMSRGALRVLLDGHPIADLEALRMIAARDLLAIHILSAPDATIRFGPSFNGGAIVLQTRGALRPVQ